MIRFARRISNLERSLPSHDVAACLADLQKVLRLPLPDATTQSELDEGFQRLIEIQTAIPISRAEVDRLTIEFRSWSDSIHAKYPD